ncbi:uncharacterized protein LOC144095155 [Amblyomma americanum]
MVSFIGPSPGADAAAVVCLLPGDFGGPATSTSLDYVKCSDDGGPFLRHLCLRVDLLLAECKQGEDLLASLAVPRFLCPVPPSTERLHTLPPPPRQPARLPRPSPLP